MIVFLKCCFLALVLFMWAFAIYNRELPKGLAEWILTVMAIVTLLSLL